MHFVPNFVLFSLICLFYITDLPESFAPIEPEVKEEPTPREQTKQRKLFRRNISEQRPGALKRQTSQACNVM